MSKRPVGIQVYGLRDLLAETPDRFEEVMKEVKAMGYDGVELAGLYGLDPAYIRDVLDRVGLVPVSAHVPLAEMMADAEKVAADYKTIGVSYIAVPYLPEEYRPLTEGYPKVIEEMKRIGAVMKAHGIQLLYHNHDFEFVTLPDGTYGFDDIYRQIDADLLKAEPDLCWIDVAIGKPAEYGDVAFTVIMFLISAIWRYSKSATRPKPAVIIMTWISLSSARDLIRSSSSSRRSQ